MSSIDDIFENGIWIQRKRTSTGYQWTVSGSIWNNLKLRTRLNGSYQKRFPAYLGAENHFKDYQSFVEWHRQQVGYCKGYDLDSDILKSGKKIYSENTCLLVPQQLNRFLQSYNKPKNDYLPQGITAVSNKYRACCSIVDETTGKQVYILDKRFNKLEEAVKAYDDAKTQCAKAWVDRLESGEFTVDQRVVEYMKNWKWVTKMEDFV